MPGLILIGSDMKASSAVDL